VGEFGLACDNVSRLEVVTAEEIENRLTLSLKSTVGGCFIR
jgi:hypothetical protein